MNKGENMTQANTENEILQLAIEALEKNVPLKVKAEVVEQDVTRTMKPDRLLRIMFQGTELRVYAEIKANFKTRADRMLFKMHKLELKEPLLLVARYVNTEMAEQLKQDEIDFIDTVGNAYINRPPLYIFIKGNRHPDIVTRPPHKRAFYATGLKVIYAFLCNPGLANKPYRDIATEAGVALGTVVELIRELKELGYLLDMGKQGNKIIQKENLFQRWLAAYPEKLRPKLILGRFRGDNDWWQHKTLNHLNAQWGGEVAAAMLTKYLKPELITIYTLPLYLNNLLIENRLRKDPAGDVEILERFWQPMETWQYKDMVHPLLVYADLIATGNKRNIETAKMIYEQHIIRLIRED